MDGKVAQLYALITDGSAAATDALLSGDRGLAMTLMEREKEFDGLYRQIEDVASATLALQGPVAADLRFLLTVLRIVPELERSHDLVDHIARRADRNLRDLLTPRARGLVERMGALAVDMWRRSSDAWAERDGHAGHQLAELDEEMDSLHAMLMGELAAAGCGIPVAMEMALVARFYERLGDHAVNVTSKVAFLVGAERSLETHEEAERKARHTASGNSALSDSSGRSAGDRIG